MNTRTLYLAISVSLLMMVGCQKEDRIVPDTSNPFYGIYSPSGQINEVSSSSLPNGLDVGCSLSATTILLISTTTTATIAWQASTAISSAPTTATDFSHQSKSFSTTEPAR